MLAFTGDKNCIFPSTNAFKCGYVCSFVEVVTVVNSGSSCALCLLGSKCSFICSKGRQSGILGQPISIRCLLSNETLLRNLTWFRGEKKIGYGSSYGVSREGKYFVLKIHRLSEEDFGNYTCNGFDVVMGNPVYSTTHLTAKAPDLEAGNCKHQYCFWYKDVRNG